MRHLSELRGLASGLVGTLARRCVFQHMMKVTLSYLSGANYLYNYLSELSTYPFLNIEP